MFVATFCLVTMVATHPGTSELPCLLAQRHDRLYCLTLTTVGRHRVHHHDALQFKMSPADGICATNTGHVPQGQLPDDRRRSITLP